MRLFVGALVVLLVFAPAVVRATRVVDHSNRPTIALSFKKSFNEPPRAADIPGELLVTPVAVVESSIAPPRAVPPDTHSRRTTDALRGPPVSVRS
jgi:hypothetical protein